MKGNITHQLREHLEVLKEILKNDYQMYSSKDIESSFIKRIFTELETKEYWIPTEQDMLDSGVIHGIID